MEAMCCDHFVCYHIGYYNILVSRLSRPENCSFNIRPRVVEGIIGRRVLSDTLIRFIEISIIGEDPCLFHAHIKS